MASPINLRDLILHAWMTNNRVTIFLVEHLPVELWEPRFREQAIRSTREPLPTQAWMELWAFPELEAPLPDRQSLRSPNPSALYWA
jgi:hypothetical protein